MLESDSKCLVPDTNVIVDNPEAIEVLGDKGNTVFLHNGVWKQLERLKTKGNGVSTAARSAISLVRSYQKRETDSHGNIVLPRGGRLILGIPKTEKERKNYDTKLKKYRNSSDPVDDMLIDFVAGRHQNELKQFRDVVLITQDVGMIVVAEQMGVKVERPRMPPKPASAADELYTGKASFVIDGDAKLFEHCATGLHRGVLKGEFEGDRAGELPAKLILGYCAGDIPVLLPNQCCTFRQKEGQREFYALYKRFPDREPVFRLVSFRNARGVDMGPKSPEQAFAFAMLSDPDIDFVTLAGPAGTGKTILTLLAGYEQMPPLEQIIVLRPIVEVGGGVGNFTHGYLKGGPDQKLAKWHRPIYDNMDRILRKRGNGPMASKLDPGKQFRDHKDMLQQQKLVLEGIEWLRGASIHSALLLCDEAQNLRKDQATAIVTRAAEESRVVFTGDLDQTDLKKGRVPNGMAHAIQRFKGWEHFGHITLTEVSVQRGRLCAEAVKRM